MNGVWLSWQGRWLKSRNPWSTSKTYRRPPPASLQASPSSALLGSSFAELCIWGWDASFIILKSYRKAPRPWHFLFPLPGMFPPGYHVVTMGPSESPICTLFLSVPQNWLCGIPPNVPRFTRIHPGSCLRNLEVGGISPPTVQTLQTRTSW